MNNVSGFIGFILIVLGVFVWLFIGFYTTKLQMKFSNTEQECGVFDKYEVIDVSRSGRVEVSYNYIYIHGDKGDKYKFRYQGRLHKDMSYLKTDLKRGQRLCFEYIHPYFKDEYGEKFLKSVELIGES